MSLKGSAHVEHEPSDVQKRRIQVQQTIGASQAPLLDATRKMLVEFNRDSQRSESGSSGGKATQWESPAGAGPTVGGQSPARAGPAAVRAILCDRGLRNVGYTGHEEADVLVGVGPERGQPDQPGKAGEIGVYPRGELDCRIGLNSSRLTYKHPTTFRGLRQLFIS